VHAQAQRRPSALGAAPDNAVKFDLTHRGRGRVSFPNAKPRGT
jgi:hypothetical protein